MRSGLESLLGHFDRIFPKAFLEWLKSLVDGERLAEFDGMSRGDFWSLASARKASLKSPLLSASLEHYDIEDGRLLWRLAEVVGRAAWQIEAGGPNPPESWFKDYKVLARLCERLRESPAPPEPAHPSRRRDISDPRLRPYIWWDVDGQRVVAVLPGRLLTAGESLDWSLSGEELPRPEAYPVPEDVRVEEAQSDALGPRDRYRISTSVAPHESIDYQVPPAFRPFVLFSADGRLLSCDSAEGYPPGEYLVLIPRNLADLVPTLRGVRELERVDNEPVLWTSWRGYRVELEIGADVAPYRIDGSGSRARWVVEGAPDHPVVFENTLPVWVGSWPRIAVEPASQFMDGLIEVESESKFRGSRSGASRILRIGHDVPVASANGRVWLDLEAAAALQETYGPTRLSCRLSALPDQPPLVLRLMRIRPIRLEYVDDPKRPGQVAAVHVRTIQSVAAGAGTILTVVSGGERVASASSLDGSPSIRLALPDSGAELRVRVPRTRVRLLSALRPLDDWREPGQLEIRLEEIALDDRLRVELHLGAELERGRPLCRLVGGAEVASGEPSRLPGTFDIPLNRWLDRLGPEATGMVQVRGRSRWVDLVRLVGLSSGTGGKGYETSERQRMVQALDRAAAREDREQVARWISACLDRVRGADASAAERETLRLAIARASVHLGDDAGTSQALEGLEGRDDLYESRVIRRALELRQGGRAPVRMSSARRRR